MSLLFITCLGITSIKHASFYRKRRDGRMINPTLNTLIIFKLSSAILKMVTG